MTAKQKSSAREKSNSPKITKVSYHHKPEDLSIEQWQIELRKQYAEIKNFNIKKEDGHQVFSDYSVYNPETKNTYKVAIRSRHTQQNFCSCLDFKTNCLGTCKHIEAVLLKINSNKRLAKSLNSYYIPPNTSIYVEYGNIRKLKVHIGSNKMQTFVKWAEKYFDKNFELKDESILCFDTLLNEAKAISDDFRCYDDALEFVLNIRETNRRKKMLEENFNYLHQENGINSIIKTNLFPYQKEGIYKAVLQSRYLIADDMGLGKTIQAIAVAELQKKVSGISSVYIICPTSLKYQWKSEIEKFTESKVLVIEGNKLKRDSQYFDTQYFYKILSYNTVLYDLSVINASKPDMIILDEAQRIKNFKAKIASHVKKIKSDHALILTGTPLENKLEELYSVIQFIDPYALGPFYKFLSEHQVKGESGKVIGYQNLNKIGDNLKYIMIRRKKSQVLDQLPKRLDKNLFVPMTEQQCQIHTEYSDAVAKIVAKWKRLGFLPEPDRKKLMIFLNMMRMVSDSTYIIDQKTRYDTKIDELMSILDEVFDEGDEKVVIFSQWERMTRLIAQELDSREIGYEYLHGGIPSKDRKNLFDNFKNKPESKVFLSTDAGGLGLNLQSASLMINMDIPWNPAVLEQRIARIYRLGQKKNVNIINLVSAGTIEHRMLDTLKFKSSLAEGVLDCGDDAIFLNEDRFKQFMNSVVELTDDLESHTEFEKPEKIFTPDKYDENDEQSLENTANPFESEGRTDYHEKEITEEIELKSEPVITEPSELINTGFQFLSGLANILSDKEKTEKLVSSIIEKDEKSGKAYVKIPVDNEKTVSNILNMFSGFISMVNKN